MFRKATNRAFDSAPLFDKRPGLGQGSWDQVFAMPLRGELKMAAERLIAFGPEIWIAEGPVVTSQGVSYPSRMAIIRLGDGGLFLWSPIGLTPGLQATVEVLGTIRYLVSPSKLHHQFLGEWKAAYPWARLIASPGLIQQRRDLAFDDKLADRAPQAWAADLDQVLVHGSFAMTEAAFFHRASATALISDLIQPPLPVKGMRGWLSKRRGDVEQPTTPPDYRATFSHRKAVRQAVMHIMGWNAERLVLARGDLVEENAAAFIQDALAWAEEK
jgi:hypothetical protein